MQLTTDLPASAGDPALEALVLQPGDAPGFRALFTDFERSTNDAIAERSSDPVRHLNLLSTWGRIAGCAVRFVPRSTLRGPTTPLVIDSSAACFTRNAGALQALHDETAFPGTPASFRLYCRNIADNTECVREFFDEDGVQFVLYRVDFRVKAVLGSVGAVWRWPYGSPLEALKLAERQAERIRTALAAGTAPAQRPLAVPVGAQR